MNAEDLDAMLAKTLDDTRLSRSEGKALRSALQDLDANGRSLTRSRAFEAARGRGDDAIDWLQSVINLIADLERDASTPGDQVFISPGEDCLNAIQARIDAAKRGIDVCVFTITDDRISRRLVDAHRKGISVRVITDNDKMHDLGSDVDRLADAGVPVAIDASGHMHHKFALFDDEWVLNGSYNWTRSAANANHENLILCADTGVLKAFRVEFESLWRRFSRL